MKFRVLRLLLAGAALLAIASSPAGADCSTDACVPGGGSTTSDCVAEWLLRPPPPIAGNGLPGRKAICYEGDPFCDDDTDIANHRCAFPLTLCINNSDSRLAGCVPTDLADFEVRKPSASHPRDSYDTANLSALEDGVSQDFGVTVSRSRVPRILGTANATADLCGSVHRIEVPLRQRRAGRDAKGRRTLRVQSADTAGRRDLDTLKLECRPSTCGNSRVESHEDCDDGNRVNGDGCNQGCRIEVGTPTPSATFTRTAAPTATATAPTPTSTVSATPTIPPPTPTETPSVPPTATATVTRTSSATITATSTNTATSTATETATATASATVSATPSITATSTITSTPTSTPTWTLPSFTLGMTGYRPLSESYGGPFQRRAVPVSENLSPGIGTRLNGDDDNNNGVADYSEASGSNENDLVEISLQGSPSTAPAGYEYVLRRNSGAIKVWNGPNKGTAVLDTNSEGVVTLSGGTRSVWVERVASGTALLEFIARPVGGGSPLSSTSVQLFAFTSVVIALGGEDQSPSDPPSSNHGMFNIALSLYSMGYDVHMYDEDDAGSSGSGPAYDEVVRAVRDRGIGIVSVYGYSHGGGSTYDLVNRLNNNRGSIGTFTIPYTAYVDSIRNSSDIDIRSETRRPPTTGYHVNYYERNDFFIKGDSVDGADVNVNVNSTPWGGGLGHGEIDDHVNVRDGVLQPLLARIPR